MEILITESGQIPFFFGRTLYDTERQGRFFNWTASGFALRFFGDRLAMDAAAFGDPYPGEGDNLPGLIVFADGREQPVKRLKLNGGRETYELFAAPNMGEHTVRVVKRTENSKGRVCVHRLLVSGEALPYTPPKRRKLEFVGDSITCGFGNTMPPEATQFNNDLEEGLEAYPEITARILDADYHSLCISGIPLCPPADAADIQPNPWMPEGVIPHERAMDEHYLYTDRNHQEEMGLTEGFARWDFARFRPDAVIINLGTNDTGRLFRARHKPVEEAYFRSRYTAFLHTLRKQNGPQAVLACTLGPMNYYLYDTIEKAVADYRAQTGDERVFSMKFAPVDPVSEGFGGLAHPNVKTDLRMGQELAEALKRWL